MTLGAQQDTSYHNLPVLITGGMGFIGSNLVHALVRQGAQVTVLDALIPGGGGDPSNVAEVAPDVRIVNDDMQNAECVEALLSGQRVIFNLAGEISHIRSMTEPLRDLAINCSAQLQFLNLCRLLNPAATIVYASSRQVYGSPKYVPVDEEHPVNPVDFNGVHKHAAEGYHFLLRQQFGMRTICLRLGNVYGPRQAIHQDCRGFIDAFLRKSLAGESIEVFGDGQQKRGLLYVDDAVDAFLKAGLAGYSAAVYNVSASSPVPLIEIARTCARVAGSLPPRLVPFPSERLSIDIGSFHSSSEKFHREFAWSPRVGLEEGLRKTLEFFKSRRASGLHASSHPVSR
ncbi:MAG: NAD-dependent epimerase/dehydratase family protein [Acidobacteria bacterium]|nr:NAD-dependent epimerase/dehydratase family protein [Acidobacteriota bacterium]